MNYSLLDVYKLNSRSVDQEDNFEFKSVDHIDNEASFEKRKQNICFSKRFLSPQPTEVGTHNISLTVNNIRK